MDTYEATNILMSKIKTIDPENVSKIMGYILIQDLNENDLCSLAFGSEALLHSVIIKAKAHLGLSSNTLSAPPSPLNPISRPGLSHNPFSTQSSVPSPRVGGSPFVHSWPGPGLGSNGVSSISSVSSISPKSSPFLSYDNIRSGSALVSNSANDNGSVDVSRNRGDLLNEYQLDEYFSFLDDLPSKGEDFGDPRAQLGGFGGSNVDAHLHRRRFSESDAYFSGEDGGFELGHRPCLYYARGFCKNGENCKFEHGGFGGGGDGFGEINGSGGVLVGSPREMEGIYMRQQEDLMRMKAVQQQRRLACGKYMNFLLQHDSDPQRIGAASAMMGDEFHKFGQFRPERNDFLAMAMEDKATSASRQIYLTFPADSTFKDEDVSNYFSTFGPVQDVRIPYQQKRMFGFVTFVHSDTVKHILSRGNPHFICDSRVLVKPYKEKGKVANNSRRQQHLQHQLMDRGNFSPCSSPSGIDPRELYDLNFGARMLYNSQEMVRRKFEQQAELQQAIELQGRRLINLQLPDLRGDFVHHHQRSLSAGAPMLARAAADLNMSLSSDVNNQDVLEVATDKEDSPSTNMVSSIAVAQWNHQREGYSIQCKDTVNGKLEASSPEGCEANERAGGIAEHALPESPFASPTKSLGNLGSFHPCLVEAKKGTDVTNASSSEITASVHTTSSDDSPPPK
ncbi:zinc finger CCCH domain-containing protein 55-like [Mercurialis annua]|uniref:zinc finger CCCH domain-containing protein 55-like n=1 Tax=Mercurialis annua TaxID=3986 RepID=UPI002160F1BF|nr:zinc finger CCCH domain-containing protein 55-like [Mercurialis annua]